jgi:hypothetical protein
MNVTLLDSEKIKRYLTLKFKGVYGIGSQGNEDADYIINCLKDFISNDNSIQGVICDFSEMEYTFGNRLAKIFVGELDLVSRLCEALRCQILRR